VIRAAVLCLCAAPAFAGDDAPLGSPLEALLPTVIEYEDLGPLWMTADAWAARGISDSDLLAYLDQDDDLSPLNPPQAPLPGTLVLLAGALATLAMVRRAA
jgi:hypothetical protein